MSSRDQKSEKIYISVYASKELCNAIQDARKEGRRCNGRQFSNSLAYELGVQTLLGINDSEEDILKQEIEDLKIQQNSIHLQINKKRELLAESEAKNKSNHDKNIKERQEVELLTSKIRESWNPIVIYREMKHIDFIVTHFKEKLTREKVAAIFPSKYEPTPTYEKVFQIASDLLGYNGDGSNV